MLLLIIFTLLIVIGVVMMKRDTEICELIGLLLAVLGSIVVFVCGLYLGLVKMDQKAEYEKMKAQYDALMTADKDDIVTLTRDIAEYNGKVKEGRELQKSLWVGLFQYDWWDDLDIIEIKHVDMGGLHNE